MGKPGFKIELFGSRIIQRTGNDGNDLVWKPQGLVELLGNTNHFLESFPGLFRVGQDKLFNLCLI